LPLFGGRPALERRPEGRFRRIAEPAQLALGRGLVGEPGDVELLDQGGQTSGQRLGLAV
jgi:hypothetical protein